MSRPGLQQKRPAAALSQARNTSQPAAHAARRPVVRDRRQTDVRGQTDICQTASSLNAPSAGA